MMKRFTKGSFLFWFLVCVPIASAQETSLVDRAAGLVIGGGGSNTGGGQGVQTDEFTGATSYSFTIPVPPARGEVEPNISINYNSHRRNPNSWVGYGWELDMGTIIRTPSGGVIDYYNGISFEARFGGQAETLTRVGYHREPSEYGLSLPAGQTVDVYQAQIESAFNLYFHVRTDEDDADIQDHGWIVVDKGGRRYEFGRSSLSREETEHPVGTFTRQWIARWLLERIVDANGNSLTISYGYDLLPSTIQYQDIAITFNVVDSNSYFPVFRQGFLGRYQVARQLSSIEVSRWLDGGWSRLQKFSFSYRTSIRRGVQELIRVTQRGQTDAESFPPTEFDYYSDSPGSWSTVNRSRLATHTIREGIRHNGYINDSSQFADMNGDGQIDHVIYLGGVIRVYFGDGGNFVDRGAPSFWSDPFPCNDDYECAGKLRADADNHQWLFLMDMNGDSLPDRVGRVVDPDDSDRATLLIAFNTGYSFSSDLVEWNDPYRGSWAGTSDKNKGFIDMNGDGLVDRVVGNQDDNGFRVYFNSGIGFGTSFTFWTDPISVADSDNSARGRIYDNDEEKIFATIRDLNGDGLPDRILQVQIRSTDDNNPDDTDTGFYVALNRNGVEWALPVPCTPEEDCSVHLDVTDNLALIDPVQEEEGKGYFTKRHDFIDFNGDGYLDRVEGDKETGQFYVYYFNGLSPGDSASYFSSRYTFNDPVSNGDGEWDASGYISQYDGQNQHTFILDLNGDNLPERVSMSPRNGDNDVSHYFEVYNFRNNAIEYSDSPTRWRDSFVSQPAGLLKSVDEGNGSRMVVEYLPSSWPLRWPSPSALFPWANHRFLPFNLFVARKVYLRDPSFNGPAVSSDESSRNPGMRWTTYTFFGGNLYIRHAQGGDFVTRSFFSRFNGFQEVRKQVVKGSGETWSDYVTVQRYHQTLGDVNSIAGIPGTATLFDDSGYGHLGLSGKPYYQLVYQLPQSGSSLEIKEESDWDINPASSGDTFACDGPCFPKLESHRKSVREAGSFSQRRSRVDYEYDEQGNVTLESHYDRSGALLLENETVYYPSSEFEEGLQMRNRPQIQRKKVGSDIYRQKEFVYDSRGNPTEERFLVDNDPVRYVTITRTFYGNGNLWQITDVDGVTKTLTYGGGDGFSLFPTSETVSLGGGETLTTTREFDRFTGKVAREISPQGSGTRVDYDSFGRVTGEYLVSTSGGFYLTRSFLYDYTTITLDSWGSLPLLRTRVWEPMPDYSDTATTPSQITYAGPNGTTYQSCTRAENGDYRVVLTRLRNGGREEIRTEPSYTASCTFTSLSGSERLYRTTRDLMGRLTFIDPPPGDADSPVPDVTIAYQTTSGGFLRKRSTLSVGARVKEEVIDDFERPISVKDPLDTTITYEYNPVGDLKFVRQGGLTITSIDYDLLGRKIGMTDADVGTWTYEYDDFGRLWKQTDNKGQRIEFAYTSLGRIDRKDIYKEDGTLEKYEEYTYDEGDDEHNVLPGEFYQVQEKNPDGTLLRQVRFGHESLFRRILKITRLIPDVGEFQQTVAHHGRGLVQYVVYPSGQQLHYQYSRTGSLAKLCSSSDCNGVSGEVYFSIDPETGFDQFGNLLKEDYGNGVAKQYSYYPFSHRLQGRQIVQGSAIYSDRNYRYDAYANILQISDPLSSVGSGGLESATYDALNRLRTYRRIGAATTMDLTYDTKGNVLTHEAGYGATAFEYNSSRPHAVTDIDEEHFDYDDNGNMIADSHRQMTYNAQNQMARVTMNNGITVDYAYDYTGGRVSKKVTRRDPLGHEIQTTTHFLGDALEIRGDRLLLHIHAGDQKVATKSLGPLSEIVGGGGAGLIDRGINLPLGPNHFIPYLCLFFVVLVLSSFKPIGRPLPAWACRAPPWVSSFRAAWRFYCESLQSTVFELPRRTEFKLVSLVLIFLAVVQFPLVSMANHRGETPPEVISDPDFFYYQHGDHLGSSHLLTEGKSESRHSGVVYQRGQLLQRFEYSPHGQEMFALNPNLSFDPSYTGQTYDIESGLYFYKSRYYNPKLGRFIQPDTVVPDGKNLQAYNRYTYVNNNPLKYVDPTGHFFWLAFIGAILLGAAIGAATSAIFGGNIWLGAIQGAIMGAAFFGAGQIIQAANAAAIAAGQTGLTLAAQASIHAAAGAISGAINATIAGGDLGDIGKATLIGAISGGLGKLSGSILHGERYITQLFGRSLVGAASGAFAAAISGGDVVKGLGYGAGYAAAGTVFNDFFHDKLFPYLRRVFHGTQVGTGTGASFKLKVGPLLKVEASMETINGHRVGSDGWESFYEDSVGLSVESMGFEWSPEFVDGKLDLLNYSIHSVTFDNGFILEVGGTSPVNPYNPAAAVNLEFHINLGEILGR